MADRGRSRTSDEAEPVGVVSQFPCPDADGEVEHVDLDEDGFCCGCGAQTVCVAPACGYRATAGSSYCALHAVAWGRQ